MTICFTGHRPNKLGGYSWNSYKNQLIMKKIKETIINLIVETKEPEYNFICGGALGIDQMAFEIVHSLKEHKKTDLPIRLFLAMPFAKQDYNWVGELDKARLQSQIQRANEVFYVDTIDKYLCPGTPVGEYHAAKMQLRNQFMVDNSDIVIAVWNGSKGGTKNCVSYAQEKGKRIITINPDMI